MVGGEEISAEPFKIKMIEPLKMTTRAFREKAIEEAGYNPFLLRSEDVYIDLLTDSGTSAMSDRQWAALMLGDEAYAGSRNFFSLEKAVQEAFSHPYVVPTHQGRGAENILYTALVKPGDYVPRNMYFTTSKAHIERCGGVLVDVIIDEAHDPESWHPFKGNVDLKKLQGLLDRVGREKIPLVNVEMNVNMAGGQPVSMENLRRVRDWCDERGIPLVFDITRGAENAYFIKERENGYGKKSCAEILREMASYADVCVMSAKKDGLVNQGGFLATSNEDYFRRFKELVVLFEGLHSYGGMNRRDMEALAQGLREVVADDYLKWRIGQVRYLGEKMLKAHLPLVVPIGGHAVFIDAKRFLPHIPQEQFPAQALTAALYLDSGIRGMERGSLSAGRDKKTGENIYPKLELVRLAIPRRVYTNSHMGVVAQSAINLHQTLEKISGLRFKYEPKVLRFFQATFEPVKGRLIES